MIVLQFKTQTEKN